MQSALWVIDENDLILNVGKLLHSVPKDASEGEAKGNVLWYQYDTGQGQSGL